MFYKFLFISCFHITFHLFLISEIFQVMGKVPVVCSSENFTALDSAPVLKRFLHGTDIATVCNKIDVVEFGKDLSKLFTMALNISGMGDMDAEWKKMLPQLLLTIKVLKPLTSLPGFPAKIRELVKGLDSLVGISLDDPNLLKLLQNREVVEAAMSMASPDVQRLFEGKL